MKTVSNGLPWQEENSPATKGHSDCPTTLVQQTTIYTSSVMMNSTDITIVKASAEKQQRRIAQQIITKTIEICWEVAIYPWPHSRSHEKMRPLFALKLLSKLSLTYPLLLLI